MSDNTDTYDDFEALMNSQSDTGYQKSTAVPDIFDAAFSHPPFPTLKHAGMFRHDPVRRLAPVPARRSSLDRAMTKTGAKPLSDVSDTCSEAQKILSEPSETSSPVTASRPAAKQSGKNQYETLDYLLLRASRLPMT
jgi:hypothetical protein